MGGCDAAQLPPLQPHFAVSSRWVQVGCAWLPRAAAQLPPPPPLQLLHGMLRPLQALILGVRMGWMCVVSGEGGAGKSSSLRLLAQLSGARLEESVLSTATDTTELLGCFEQTELSRLQLETLQEADELGRSLISQLAVVGVSELSRKCLGSVSDSQLAVVGAAAGNKASGVAPLELAAALQGALETLAADGAEERAVGGPSPPAEWNEAFERRAVEATCLLDSAVDCLRRSAGAAAGDSGGAAAARVSALRSRNAAMASLRESGGKGRFTWVDGPLVRAMEGGHWLVLDNANLANPSVLDRLNPLFERGGRLLLPECGLKAGGVVREVAPRPGFRLFLCVSPAAGELSRAMRNRGLEVTLLPPPAAGRDVLSMLRTEGRGTLAARSLDAGGVPGTADMSRTCRRRLPDEGGVPGAELCLELLAAHAQTGAARPRALLHCGEVLVSRLASGLSLRSALTDATDLAYAGRGLPDGARAVAGAALARCDPALLEGGGTGLALLGALRLDRASSPARPAWPVGVSSAGFADEPEACTVRGQASLSVQLAALVRAGVGCRREGFECRPAELLRPALLEFVLRASERDARRRRALLVGLAERAGAEAEDELPLAVALLDGLRSSPLARAAGCALREACAASAPLLLDLCSDSPCDLQRFNPPLFDLVRRHAAPHAAPDAAEEEAAAEGEGRAEAARGTASEAAASPSASSEPADSPCAEAWRRYVALLPPLRLACELEWRGHVDTARLARAAECVAPSELSLLQLSYARRAAGAPAEAGRRSLTEGRAAWEALAGTIYPALAAIGDALAGWLAAPGCCAAEGGRPLLGRPSAREAEPPRVAAVRAVAHARRALWTRAEACYPSDSVAQDVLLLWRPLLKRLRRAAAPPLALPLPSAASAACDALSAAVGYESSRLAPLLWKRGGHPQAAPSAALLAAYTQLLEVAASGEGGDEALQAGSAGEARGAGSAAAPLRRALLMGAATLRCSFSATPSTAVEERRLVEIPSAVRATLQAGRLAPERGGGRLAPLVDARSARHEADLLARLASLSWRQQSEEDTTADGVKAAGAPSSATRAEAAEVAALAASLVDLVADHCGRSALDAAPAQSLLWRLQAPPTAEAGRAPPLGGIAQQVALAWHRHLWTGAVWPAAPAAAPAAASPHLVGGGPSLLLLSTDAAPVASLLRAARDAPMVRRRSVERYPR